MCVKRSGPLTCFQLGNSAVIFSGANKSLWELNGRRTWAKLEVSRAVEKGLMESSKQGRRRLDLGLAVVGLEEGVDGNTDYWMPCFVSVTYYWQLSLCYIISSKWNHMLHHHWVWQRGGHWQFCQELSHLVVGIRVHVSVAPRCWKGCQKTLEAIHLQHMVPNQNVEVMEKTEARRTSRSLTSESGCVFLVHGFGQLSSCKECRDIL